MNTKIVKALTLEGKGDVKLKEYPYPKVEKDSVLIRMEYSGICGTDKHSYQGWFDQKGGRSLPLPVIQGHENVGVVEEIGSEFLDYDGRPLKVGDRVIPAPNVPCGRCYSCRNNHPYYYCAEKRDYGNNIGAGDPPHLFGGWSEYMYILPRSYLFSYPKHLPVELGTLIEPFSVTACLDKARQWSSEWEPFRSGDTVVVMGTGPIGIMHILKAHLLGTGKLIAVDKVKFRLKIAEKLGANHSIVNNSIDELKDKIMELTNNRGADLVVDCTGLAEGLSQSLELIREGGMILEVGAASNSTTVNINPHFLFEKSARIIGVGGDEISQYMPSIKILERTLDYIPWDSIISHKYKISQIDEAMQQALGDESMKVLLSPN